MRARLIPLDGGPAVELVKDLTVVGRADDADLKIDHKSVSKLHCVLVKTDGLVLVRDLGSTNGTRVNGQRVRRAALLPNDQLAVANFRYRLKFGDAADDPASVSHSPNPDALPDAVDTPPPVAKPDAPPLKRNALPDVYPG